MGPGKNAQGDGSMLINDGVITPKELEKILPDENRLNKGPVAILECMQDIPCDPCVYACPVSAIKMEVGITDKPEIDYEKCTGCGACIPKCPGLAIFLIKKITGSNMAELSMSHELLPIPQKGEKVIALDRTGSYAGEAEVVRVLNPPAFDKTAVVTLKVPYDKIMNIRAFRSLKEDK